MHFFFKKWRGKHVGNYKIIDRLGEGRYGISFLAATNRDELVVIKRFKPRIFKKNKQKNAYEAVILSQIDHPAVPKLIGVINERDFYGFVLEHKPGNTLETMLFKRKVVFTKSDIFNIGCQLIRVLTYLHGKGIVHRDLRIPNVLLYNGEVSLIDFGLSRWADGDRYHYDQDFSYLGDLLLYLHYSSFEKKTRESQPWYMELNLTDEQIHIYKRMLRLEDPYETICEVERDFLAAFSADNPG